MFGVTLVMLGLFWLMTGPGREPAPVPTRELGWSEYAGSHLRQALPLSDGFDFPLCPPDGRGAYIQRGFRERGCLGEEWSLVPEGGGDASVHASGSGVVILADDFREVWGHVVVLLHRMPAGGETEWVETMYADLAGINVKPAQWVRRGEVLGHLAAVGPALHFEVRIRPGHGLGPGDSDQAVQDWVRPQLFLQQNRHQMTSKAGTD